MTVVRWQTVARRLFQVLVAMFFCGGLFLVFFVPYHTWDALSYGEWSLLIADTGRFHFPTVTDQTYHRPLFYVSQGWIWRLAGHHDALGRVFGLTFAVLLVFAVWKLSKEFCADSLGLSPYVGVSLLLAISGVAAGFCSGLTDVPVAAMVGCAAAALWTRPPGKLTTLLVFLLPCAAMLTKPSALTALMGLGAAHLVGPKNEVMKRISSGCLPLAAGTALALIYDSVEAHRLHLPLRSFLIAGASGYYEKMSAAALFNAFWDFGWLGEGLRFSLVLSVLYAAFRIANIQHRRALAVAGPIAIALSWLGPWLVAGHSSGDITSARAAYNLVVLLTGVVLAVACVMVAGEDGVASQVNLARLVVWIAPGLLSWFLYAAYDIRLLSAAWAPMAVLACAAIAPIVVDGLRSRRWTGVATVGIVLLLAASNIARLDGLDWRAAGATVADGKISDRDFRQALMPDLERLIEILEKTASPKDMMMSPEGRLRFYFPGRVSQAYPGRCSELNGYNYFVLTTGSETESYFQTEIGVPGTIAYWSSCVSPVLTLVATTDAYAVFRIDRNGS